MSESWKIKSSNRVTVKGLKDADGNFVNTTSSFSGQMKDSNDVDVGGSIPFSYITDSNGNWKAVVPISVTDLLTLNSQYYLEFVAVASSVTLTGRFTRIAKHVEI